MIFQGLKNLNAAGTQQPNREHGSTWRLDPYDVQNFALNQCKAVEGEEHREMRVHLKGLRKKKLVSR